MPNVPPLSPPQLLDGGKLLVAEQRPEEPEEPPEEGQGGGRWAHPSQQGLHGAPLHGPGAAFPGHSRAGNLSAGVPSEYRAQPAHPAHHPAHGWAAEPDAGAVFTLGSAAARLSRTMPAACGVGPEEEQRRRLVAQVYGESGGDRGAAHRMAHEHGAQQAPGGRGAPEVARRNMGRPQSAGPRSQRSHGGSPTRQRERPRSGEAAHRGAQGEAPGVFKEGVFKEGKVGWCSSSMARGAYVTRGRQANSYVAA